MSVSLIIGGVALVFAGMAGVALLYFLFAPRQEASLRNLMSPRSGAGSASEIRQRLQNDTTGRQYELLKRTARNKLKGKEKITLEERFFRAGMFTDQQKRDFSKLRVLCLIIGVPLGIVLASFLTSWFGPAAYLGGMVLGVLLGLQAPTSILDRQISARNEDILFFLPLVIEQIAIGVSSSLDIGPCLQRVVAMADERDSHNAVTELVRYAEYYVRTGVSLEDSLNEIGKMSGHTELKHAFLSLSQVAKHGGEITKQLQELADAVQAQREAAIDGKIKKLELEATLPVTMVFAGFMLILLIGFFIQIKGAF